MTRLLVLGGSAFVGRAIVDDALARGWDVTTFNCGVTAAAYAGGKADTAVGGNADTAVGADADTAVGADAGGAQARPGEGRITRLIGDRTDVAALSQLTASRWDLVADTWSGAPAVVRDSARLLADRAGRYIYISSGSVYAPVPPVGAREDAPTIDASPNDADADASDYARSKRGAELAVLDVFGPERALIARPGLIIGPHEDVGRLPWWLERVSRGGEVLAPRPPERLLQLIDARDLARFVLDAATGGHAGVFNTVSRRGHATTQTLLDSCMDVAGAPDARLTWVAADVIDRQGSSRGRSCRSGCHLATSTRACTAPMSSAGMPPGCAAARWPRRLPTRGRGCGRWTARRPASLGCRRLGSTQAPSGPRWRLPTPPADRRTPAAAGSGGRERRPRSARRFGRGPGHRAARAPAAGRVTSCTAGTCPRA
jgi:2'-hydroxyisoflavone reductase